MFLKDLYLSVVQMRYRTSLISAAITFLVVLIGIEAVLLFSFHTTFPSASLCSQISYLLALLGVFFAPLAFLTTCTFKVSPISMEPFLKTAIIYVLPITLIQIVYSIPCGEITPALSHGLYLLSLLAGICGFHSLLHSLGLNYDMRKIIVIAVFVISLATVVIFNSIIEESSENREKIIEVIMISNPIVATSAIYNRDILRGKLLYNRSVIGQFYHFNYPSTAKASGFYLFLALIMGTLATIVHWLLGEGRKKEEEEEGSPSDNGEGKVDVPDTPEETPEDAVKGTTPD